jgi:hypothetical protein
VVSGGDRRAQSTGAPEVMRSQSTIGQPIKLVHIWFTTASDSCVSCDGCGPACDACARYVWCHFPRRNGIEEADAATFRAGQRAEVISVAHDHEGRITTFKNLDYQGKTDHTYVAVGEIPAEYYETIG